MVRYQQLGDTLRNLEQEVRAKTQYRAETGDGGMDNAAKWELQLKGGQRTNP